ncbi:MAG: hypothetical protein H7Z10_13775 [Gemmatimonadaceae bacterium]|nr:hypothetical protein [Acetobacteraceae bacterium]
MSVARGPAYGAALVLGVVFVACLFPVDVLVPADYRWVAQFGDRAQGMIAQRYFLGAPWGWPPLVVPALDNTNVGLADSLPLVLLPLKPFQAWLPPGFFVQEGWIAAAWLLQPAAAVYALRGTGTGGWPATLAVAALSLLPTLLARFGHAALCTHALILLAIGLYLRLTVRGAGGWWACVPLLLASLLLHPYLLAMVAAVLLAGPLDLLLTRRRWRPATVWLTLGLVVTGVAAVVLGFGGGATPSGYGVFSMNLLAPLLPSRSGLFPELAIDATGGQIGEGYQYLGAGLLALMLLAAALTIAGRAPTAWGRHIGLLLVLGGLTLFAASGQAYAGRIRVLDVPTIPAFVQQFRVTGRFFWPVAYVALIWTVVTVARGLPGRGAALALSAAVGLQAADMSTNWGNVRLWLHPIRWEVDAGPLSRIIAAHERVTLWPTSFCGVDGGQTNFMQVLLVASQTRPRVNTMYTARVPPSLVCDAAATLGQPWQSKELRIILPQAAAEDWRQIPDSEALCQPLGAMLVCSRDQAALATGP